MGTADNLLHWSIVESIGWALIHSTWQIGLLALVYLTLRACLRIVRLGSVRRGMRDTGRHGPRAGGHGVDRLARRLADAPVAWAEPPIVEVSESAEAVVTLDSGPVEGPYVGRRRSHCPRTPCRLLKSAGPAAARGDPRLVRQRGQRASTLAGDRLVSGRGRFLGPSGLWLPGHAPAAGSGASPAADAMQKVLTRLAGRLGVDRAVTLVQSALVEVPTVVGHLRPVILLPVSMLTGLSAEHIEAILAHELAHIRRHDYLINLAQTAIETLLFYHPAMWWVSHQIRQEREHCCDDLALSVCGDGSSTPVRWPPSPSSARTSTNRPWPPRAEAL